MKNIIYGLTDPRTGEIRYIGKSTNGMRRPNIHSTPSCLRDETHKTHWIRELRRNGLRYGIVVLATTADKCELNKLEKALIAKARSDGWRLTNATDGGDGQSPGYITRNETKRKLSAFFKGRKFTRRVIRKIARGVRAAWKNPEVRAHQVAAIKTAASTRDYTCSDETRARISEASKKAWRNTRRRMLGLKMLRMACAVRSRNAALLRSQPGVVAARDAKRREYNKLWMRRYPFRWRAQTKIGIERQRIKTTQLILPYVESTLRLLPHPNLRCARQGKTALDFVTWAFGVNGWFLPKRKAADLIEAVSKQQHKRIDTHLYDVRGFQ